MKLYCFVILIFISVIFTVGEEREWGNGGIRGVYSLPTSATNQNKVITNSYSQPLLVRRSLAPGDTVSTEDPKSLSKHPSQTPNLPIDDNGKTKPKHFDGNNDTNAQSQNAESKETAEKLEEEAQTIKKVIVVLCSLGASLLLVAIAIAVLYWKVRRQQQALSRSKSSSKGSSRGGDTAGSTGSTNDDDNNNINNNGNVKRDSVGGVGGETSDGNSLPLIIGEKIINNSDSLVGVNNGVTVCDKVNDEVPYIRYTQFHNIPQQLPPSVQPSAPSEEKLIGDNDLGNNNNGSNIPFSSPHLADPPAYSPTAPPIYALPHIPIPEFDGSMELYMNSNYQSTQQYNPHNLNPLYPLPPNNGVWYAAGPTSQTDTSVDDTFNQQSSHSTIIPSSSTVDLNSSSNSHGNNNDNRPTHQRHNSSTI